MALILSNNLIISFNFHFNKLRGSRQVYFWRAESVINVYIFLRLLIFETAMSDGSVSRTRRKMPYLVGEGALK